MEIWSDAGEIICEMRDGGVIADPASAGRQPPAADASGGHGLWLARQICDKVELHSDSDGTTIRLHMSLPPPGRQARDSPGPNGAAYDAGCSLVTNPSLPEIYLIHRMTQMDVGASQQRMAAFLRDNHDKVVGSWSELVAAGLRGRTSAQEARRELEDLYSLVIRELSGTDEDAAGELRAVLDELSRNRARDGFTPSETALSVFALKEAVYELVAESADLVPEYLAFSRVVDDLGLRTFEAFSAAREQIITDQTTSMMELSTPVVRLWDGIIAVPLVGTLDSARTQLVMEKLLETLVATGADHAVIDITGVPTVDTEVAQHLLKTVSAARLLGAECTISGIRPQVAQTIVSLGIEFGDIATKATLADALALALKHAGLKVVPA